MAIRASIDLGTNTCLLLIAEVDPSGKKVSRVIEDHSQIVRLGEGVDRNRKLKPEAMERAYQCLSDYAARMAAAEVLPEAAICVATSQARDAQNSAEFFARIKKETGLSFRVLSGDEEAQATFLGALLPGMDPKTSSVIDIGGGSTEIITAHEKRSLDLGSVRFTERFLKSNPVTDEEFWACQEAIDQGIGEMLSAGKSGAGSKSHLGKSTGSQNSKNSIVAVAGTATTLAAWHLGLNQFDPARVDQVVLSRGDVHRMVEELKWRTVEERRALPCMEPLRADVILAGALILWRALELLNFSSCQASTRGLRYGVLLK